LGIITFQQTERIYAGHWQLSAGAWKWVCSSPNLPYDIGSCFTAAEILKAKKISYEKLTNALPEIWVDDP